MIIKYKNKCNYIFLNIKNRNCSKYENELLLIYIRIKSYPIKIIFTNNYHQWLDSLIDLTFAYTKSTIN